MGRGPIRPAEPIIPSPPHGGPGISAVRTSTRRCARGAEPGQGRATAATKFQILLGQKPTAESDQRPAPVT